MHPLPQHIHVAIVGAGFSGIGAAIRLKREGFDDFVILERAEDLGGVWRDNTYPGAACDVRSHLYSYSFAPNPRWSHSFSRQSEIWAYLRRCAEEHGVLPHVRYGHPVLACDYEREGSRWRIETSRGTFTADFLIAAVGGLSEPSIPDLPGLSNFQGKVFHSARWDHSYDLRGRRVAVIGTGASAIQFVPEIQPRVAKLSVFQRTASWVVPRDDRVISALERRLFAAFPRLQKLARAAIYARQELIVLALRNPRVLPLLERIALRYLHEAVPDAQLRAKLTPNFHLGCKRVLLSNDYLPALTRDNVELVTAGIRELRGNAIVTADGREHPVDAIAFGTGFHIWDMPFAARVRGPDRRSLRDVWQGSPEAYLGTTVAGFPNLFLLLGPGTGLGHSSVLYMLESQLELVAGALKHMRREGFTTIEPHREVQARYVRDVQRMMQGTVWVAGGCASWYLDANGKNSTLWPGFTFAFRRQARFHPEQYALGRRVALAAERIAAE